MPILIVLLRVRSASHLCIGLTVIWNEGNPYIQIKAVLFDFCILPSNLIEWPMRAYHMDVRGSVKPL